MCGSSNILLLVFILGILLAGLVFLHKRKSVIDSFDNLEDNLFTYDSCCSQQEIAHCETYGKTGVCNYNNYSYSNNYGYSNNYSYSNNNTKSCLCQNAF